MRKWCDGDWNWLSFDFKYSIVPVLNNKVADALSRCAAVHDLRNLTVLHSQLCHPGVTRLYHYVKARNLPFSVEDVRAVTKACKVCAELKPSFYRPPQGRLIHATRAWERVSVDFVGPLPSKSQNKFLLVVIDEFSRFPFAFPCRQITTAVVIKHLQSLFALFGSPSALHADRGPQFESAELREFLLSHRVVKTRTSPYRPQGNGQCERENGTITKAIQLALRSLGLPKTHWEDVLPLALASTRTLLCTATNNTPHERFCQFPRSSVVGTEIPKFLRNPGSEVLLRNRMRGKFDPLVQKVRLVETISPHFSRVEYSDGKVDTVSTRDLAPIAESLSPEAEHQAEEVDEANEECDETEIGQASCQGTGTANKPSTSKDTQDLLIIQNETKTPEPLMGNAGRKWTDIDARNIIHGSRRRGDRSSSQTDCEAN